MNAKILNKSLERLNYRSLLSLGQEDIINFGYKACTLAKVSSFGFQTPVGYALSISPLTDLSTLREPLLGLASQVRDEWASAPVAVRSSTSWEDSSSSSAAGKFLSILDCESAECIANAVIRVSSHANQVAENEGLRRDPTGILIQPMINGQISGVCFTSHWKDPSALVLEYAEGSCGQIVVGTGSGRLRSYAVSDLATATGERDLLHRVALTCWRLRAALDMDLDIEWTVREGEVVILQARPLTGLNGAEAEDELWEAEVNRLEKTCRAKDVLTSLSIGEVFGNPKPLFGDLISSTLSKSSGGLGAVFTKFGLKYNRSGDPCFTVFCARPFINLDAYARALGLSLKFSLRGERIGWRLAPWRLGTIMRLLNSAFHYPAALRSYLRSIADRTRALSMKQYASNRTWPQVKERLIREYVPFHLEADVLSAVYQGMLLPVLSIFCGGARKAEAVHQGLAFGFANPNVGTNIDLYRFGRGRISWEEFVARQGHRGQPDWDLSARRYWESPQRVQTMARSLVQARVSPEMVEKRRQRRGRLLDHFLSKRLWYRRLRPFLKLERYLVCYREKSQHLLYRQVDQLRKVVLKIAEDHRFPEDLIFFLHESELLGLPAGREDLLEKARERKSLHIIARGIPVSTSFVSPNPKRLEETALNNGDAIEGMPVSQGIYTGPAYVARSLDELDEMPEGHVLVVSVVDPAWSALLYLAGAIVSEQGGMFCHSSILIRELGIPAVAKLSGACERIRSGDLVRVNGTNGTVEVL